MDHALTCALWRKKSCAKGRNGCDDAWKKNCGSKPQLFPPTEKKPLQSVQHRKLTIKTMAGDIVLPAEYGRDVDTGRMVMPLREQLGLEGRQPMSPALEDRLCHLAVAATSYERAAEVARRFGIATDDSQLQRLVQRVGERAIAQEEERVSLAFDLGGGKAVSREAGAGLAGERFSMVLMLDGTMLRNRGVDWGLKPATAPGERVAWHELKAGLVIRLPAIMCGRGAEKFYVASAGEAASIGRKLYAEALRRGLEQAERVYVIADGAVWIWRLAAEHFPEGVGTLDFYHASEHLWVLARSLFGESGSAAQAWVEPLLHNLKHGGGEDLLSLLERLVQSPDASWDAAQREVLRRESNYFHSHAEHLDYSRARREGMPLGSGAMESACSQLQGRFKRPGQFWSPSGEQHLLALELAWRNGDWPKLWAMAA